MSVCVNIDGDLVRFDRPPTDEDVAAWRELRKAITAALPELTAEQTPDDGLCHATPPGALAQFEAPMECLEPRGHPMPHVPSPIGGPQ